MRQPHRQDLAGRLSIFVNCKSCNIVKIVRKKKFICKVTVKQPVTSIKLNKTSATLNKGKSLTLKVTVLPGNANNKSVTWSSSNQKVATVSSKGVVKAVEDGKAVIVAKATSRTKNSCRSI